MCSSGYASVVCGVRTSCCVERGTMVVIISGRSIMCKKSCMVVYNLAHLA